jgi:hypothetical protein
MYGTFVATGIFIAQHESALNTAALSPSNSDGSRDNGIFQVSSRLLYNKETKSPVSMKKFHMRGTRSLYRTL